MIGELKTAEPVYFYLPDYERFDQIDELDPFEAWQEMPRGEGFWILQTYCLLRHFGVAVQKCRELPKRGIVVFHRHNRRQLFSQPIGKFKELILVGCRGDLHDLLVSDFELLQNSYFADGKRRFHMPHWPMPGIIPRDVQRKTEIKRIAFLGFAAQLHPDFQSKEWREFLEHRGIEWVQNSVSYSRKKGESIKHSDWADYSTFDLVVAVRPERNDLHTNKPALKLYNAWIAGVPSLLGPEIAYREAGVSGEDYIEVQSLEDAKQAIDRLIQDPNLYSRLISNGRKKADRYSHESVAKAWVHFFNKTLSDQIPERKRQFSYKLSRRIPFSLQYKLVYAWKWLLRKRMR